MLCEIYDEPGGIEFSLAAHLIVNLIWFFSNWRATTKSIWQFFNWLAKGNVFDNPLTKIKFFDNSLTLEQIWNVLDNTLKLDTKNGNLIDDIWQFSNFRAKIKFIWQFS